MVAFHDDLSDLFDRFGAAIDADKFVCCGDFNCGGVDSTSISLDLQTLFDAHGLEQFVQSPTRHVADCSSLLDLVVCRSESNRISQVAVQPSHGVSDHELVTWSLSTSLKLKPQLVSFKFRQLKNVDWVRFQEDDYAEQLDSVITSHLDRVCPLQVRRRFMSTRRDNRWLSDAAVDAKRSRRRLERQWRSTGRAEHYIEYRKSCRSTNKIITESRGKFYNERIVAAAEDPRRRWAAFRDILHLNESRQVRLNDENTRLSEGFAQFFVEKIRTIKAAIYIND
jgi:hypothetical protein